MTNNKRIRRPAGQPNPDGTGPLDPDAPPLSKRTRQMVASQAKFSGPIPPPEIFRDYATVMPDAPERILKVFEEDSAFIRDIQLKALEAQREENRRAQYMAWFLVLAGLVSATALGWEGREATACMIAGTTLIGVLTGFLRSGQTKENGPKKDPSPN